MRSDDLLPPLEQPGSDGAMKRWLAVVMVLAGCGAGQGEPCSSSDDCIRELECACQGAAQDPCRPGMTPQQCEKARCGKRVCRHPGDPQTAAP